MATKIFKVTDGPLSIRTTPQGTRSGQYLLVGQDVEVQADSRTEAGGYIWWKHSLGWSAERATSGADVYMVETVEQTAEEDRFFKVVDGPLSIRDAANGNRLEAQLAIGTTIEVVPSSRTEAGGFVWWQHDQGWSAEKNSAGTTVYLQEVFKATEAESAATRNVDSTTSAAPTPPPPPEPEPEPEPQPVSTSSNGLSGQVKMQAKISVKVRDQPSTAANVRVLERLPIGTALTCNMDDVRQASGYYWVQHEKGWSAWKTADGSNVYLVEAGTVPGLVAIGPDGPQLADLPGYQSMITQLPVSIANMTFWQYFGNNTFAYLNGKSYNYDGYSQGLHGGLDFGNYPTAGIPVVAGLEAQFVKIDRSRARNHKVYLKKDDYTIIYQHVTNMVGFTPGQTISPETKIAEIENHAQGGWDHLHFEIRYKGTWIINPLALMKPELVEAIIKRFNPERANVNYKSSGSQLEYFYKTASWTQWTTPMDQPVIKLAGPVVGPRG